MSTQLPHGWSWASPAELASPEKHCLGIGPFGSDLKVTDYRDCGTPLVFVRNIRAGSFLLPNQPMVSPAKAAQLLAHRVAPGDVLITKMGEPPGDAAVYPDHAPEGRMTADCIRLRVNPDVSTAKFVMYATQSPVVKGQILTETKGVAQKKISLERFRTVRYPLPALAEQHRIVATIETHFSRLDAAVASLKRAKANVKRARASVLKAAVEGRLVPTEAELARTESRDYEPASALLARILVERKAAWTASGVKGKYKEAVAPETEDLPELPEGWLWASADQLAWASAYGTSVKCGAGADGPPVLRIPNVQSGIINLDDLKFATDANALKADGALMPGDLVFVRTNGSLRLIGLGACVLAPLPATTWFASYLIRLRLCGGHDAWRWTTLVWNGPVVRRSIERDAASSAGQFNVSMTTALKYVLPVPPLAEQRRIVAEVDRRLSVLDALSITIDANLARCAKLRQSILKRAFEGRLVSHDPTERPGLTRTVAT